MYKKENHLTKVRDFALVLKYGHWINGGFLSLKVLILAKARDYFPKKEDVDKFEKQLKIAINVGIKVSKKAVERNRAKRQIREVIRLLMEDSMLKTGFYLFFDAKPNIKEKDYSEISQEVKVLLNKAGVLA